MKTMSFLIPKRIDGGKQGKKCESLRSAGNWGRYYLM
jgi:hypothetical protein